VPLRVRMALHTGEADLREGDYYGPAVNRCARLRAVAHGGQVLLAVNRVDDFVAVGDQPGAQDVAVEGMVVGHQDARRGSHDRCSRNLARGARGLKGFVT
jgi:class 3 adenylate cyclase